MNEGDDVQFEDEPPKVSRKTSNKYNFNLLTIIINTFLVFHDIWKKCS